MKVSRQKAIGWIILTIGAGGILISVWSLPFIGFEDKQLLRRTLPWMIGAMVLTVCTIAFLVRCYRIEPLRGRRILHLSLLDLIAASLLAAAIMGTGRALLSEQRFLLLAQPLVPLAIFSFLVGLALAGRLGLAGWRRYLYGLALVPVIVGALALGALTFSFTFAGAYDPNQIREIIDEIINPSRQLSELGDALVTAFRGAVVALPIGLLLCWLARRGHTHPK